jgi:hypothetical protein
MSYPAPLQQEQASTPNVNQNKPRRELPISGKGVTESPFQKIGSKIGTSIRNIFDNFGSLFK